MIFTICSITTFIIRNIGNRRKSVRKKEFVDRRQEIIIWLCEYKLGRFISIYKNTTNTWRSFVTTEILRSVKG